VAAENRQALELVAARNGAVEAAVEALKRHRSRCS
jgi:hypothetical protein